MFLNPERVTMPDIDTDYADNLRYKVIEYVLHKYGADKVAHIRAYGTQGAKVSIRDVGAVLEGYDKTFVDKVAKLVPTEPKMTIKKAIQQEPEIGELYKNDPSCKILLDYAMKIEGLVRQTSSHAAGIIISDKPLTEYGALTESEDDEIPIFSTDMHGVEQLKLLKMDFLGLRTLTVLEEAKNLIKEDFDIDVDYHALSMDDPDVFRYISTGDTDCVFQLESSGMQEFMSELQPTSLEDLILGVSVYRPGPMDSIPDIIKGKQDPKSIEYPQDAAHILAPILDVTYGNMVYQEQVMSLVREMAGYSFGRSDLIRRAMSKKKADLMKAEQWIFTYGEVICPDCEGTGLIHGEKCIRCDGVGKVAAKRTCPWCKGEDHSCSHCNGSGLVETKGEYTVKGCVNNGISVDTANQLYDKMIIFSAYAFNKSHATAYAMLAYQTAWMKYYYPKQYQTAYLNSFLGNPPKLKNYIFVTKKMGIPVIPPNINTSDNIFIEDKDGIYMGLSAIKHVGKNMDAVIAERKAGGKFENLEDLLLRCNIGKGELESLAKSGALDGLGYNRSEIITNAEAIVNAAKKEKERLSSGQLSFFDIGGKSSLKFPIHPMFEYPELELYKMEKELTGFYLSGHPLSLPQYKKAVRQSTISTVTEFNKEQHGKPVVLVGILSYDDKKEGVRTSSKGNRYAQFHVEDFEGDIGCVMFKETVNEYAKYVVQDSVVKVEGNILLEERTRTNENGYEEVFYIPKIKVNKLTPIENLQDQKKLYIQMNNMTEKVSNLIKSYPGQDLLIWKNPEQQKVVQFNRTVNAMELQKQLTPIIGSKNVVIR